MSQAEICIPQSFTPIDPLEDGLMTFQVCLVGNDGIILGSDRRVAVRGSESGRQTGWQFMAGSKFLATENESVICSFAGGPQAQSIALEIVRKAPNRNPLGRPQDATWQSFLRDTAELVAGNSVGDEVLVVRTDECDAALVTRSGLIAGVCRIEERICTGVTATARFLTQHFWKPNSVESLKPLALLTLDYAARERPSEVGFGFDLMLLRKGSRPVWELYAADDDRIIGLRERFHATVASCFSSTAL
jgi:hypothetical protein